MMQWTSDLRKMLEIYRIRIPAYNFLYDILPSAMYLYMRRAFTRRTEKMRRAPSVLAPDPLLPLLYKCM